MTTPTPTLPPLPEPADDRAAFEAWAQREKLALNRHQHSYAATSTAWFWDSWQAAAAAEREACAAPTEAMELAGMRALRNTPRTVSGQASREQARACWDAMIRARKP